jgi:hypothetical protein
VHETSSRKLSLSSAGTLTAGPIDQLFPFHLTVYGRVVGSGPVPVEVSPTAMQNETEVHDIENSTAVVTPDGAGTCCVDHVEPFQTWTYTFVFGFNCSTVAAQNAEDTHETELS